MTRKIIYWFIFQLIMIGATYFSLLFLLWIRLIIQTDINTVSIDSKRGLIYLSVISILGMDLVTRIMRLSFVKRHSGFFGWLVIIISFGVGGYLSIKYGY